MTLIVAVKSCQADRERGYHNIIRSTWGQDLKALGIETKFFVGRSTDERKLIRYEKDEVVVEAPDDYNGLPYKTRAIARWATGKLVDHIFLCDTDTYVKAKALSKFNFSGLDYIGSFGRPFNSTRYYDARDRNGFVETHPKCYPWASGGFGYALSKNALQMVYYEAPTSWAEDLWIGQLLSPYCSTGELIGKDIEQRLLSEHFPSLTFGGPYEPKYGWMEEQHEKFK